MKTNNKSVDDFIDHPIHNVIKPLENGHQNFDACNNYFQPKAKRINQVSSQGKEFQQCAVKFALYPHHKGNDILQTF